MNESKSQLELLVSYPKNSCYKYQNINERKQITTPQEGGEQRHCCYKYQNINERKQITTPFTDRFTTTDVVTNIRISMNESKSQLQCLFILLENVVTNIRISMNESKSQHKHLIEKDWAVVTNIRISMNESKSQL